MPAEPALRAGGRLPALDVQQILERDRQPVQRTARAARARARGRRASARASASSRQTSTNACSLPSRASIRVEAGGDDLARRRLAARRAARKVGQRLPGKVARSWRAGRFGNSANATGNAGRCRRPPHAFTERRQMPAPASWGTMGVSTPCEDAMTYRSIFVHADDTEPCARRLDYAARLATRYPAELLASYLPSPSELTDYAKAVMAQAEIDKYAHQRAGERQRCGGRVSRLPRERAGVDEYRVGRADAQRRSAPRSCARGIRILRSSDSRRATTRTNPFIERARQRRRDALRPPGAARSFGGRLPDHRRARADRVEGFARVGAGRRRRAAAPQEREEGDRGRRDAGGRRDGERAVHRRAVDGVPAPARGRGDRAADPGRGHRRRASCCCRRRPTSAPT